MLVLVVKNLLRLRKVEVEGVCEYVISRCTANCTEQATTKKETVIGTYRMPLTSSSLFPL
jgi:hypothetical protein